MKNRMKMIWTALVGEIGQGKCSKAWIEPTDWITHQMRGLGTWLLGGASCLYWKASIPIFPQPLTGFSTRLKGYCRQRLPAQPPQKCQVEQEVPCAKPSPKRRSLQLNAKGRGGGGSVGAYSRWLVFGKIIGKWPRGNPCWPRWGME